jgi:Na+-transporting methylmalonyl-CoA/oxaloacetate decarboxylase gamma subunit
MFSMYFAMYVVHVIFAILLLVYLFFPAMIRRASSMPTEKQASQLKGIIMMNRLGQAALALAFLSGGYMIGKVFDAYSILWLIVTILLVLIIGAMGGMMARPLRQWKENAGQSTDASAQQKKASTFGMIAAFSSAAIIIIMLYPNILG